jgi:4,5-DOPA dioxygenase extradiol
MDRKNFLQLFTALTVTGQVTGYKYINMEAIRNNESERMPVFFMGHGSPMNAIGDNYFVQGWKESAKSFPAPAAILCISAHWETAGTSVTAMEKPETIHDFGGFPPELYKVEYPAPGSPGLAHEIRNTIKGTSVGLDFKWGLDHGTWSVVKHMYPGAGIPVLQLSLDYSRSPQFHYNLAKELSVLRRKGVLILGSGNIVHNLRLIAWDKLEADDYGYDWTREAVDKMKGFILKGDHNSLIDYKGQGESFRLAIPTPDHYLPLLYVLALQEKDETPSFFNDRSVGGSLAMTCVRIGQ